MMSQVKVSSLPQIISKLVLPAVSALALVPAIVTTFPSSADANVFCQCTQYVANRAGLSKDYPNAKDWNDRLPRYNGNSYLGKNGLRPVNPRVGAVVVMESSFPGADRNFGHVGFVERITTNGSGTFIQVRGANQIGTRFTESGCNNVTVMNFGTSINRGDISFWAR